MKNLVFALGWSAASFAASTPDQTPLPGNWPAGATNSPASARLTIESPGGQNADLQTRRTGGGIDISTLPLNARTNSLGQARRPAGALPLAAMADATADRIYIANDDHTDYMWSGDEAAYRRAFISMLDYYMGRADATADRGRRRQAKFNADGSFWFWEYERAKSPAEFARLIEHFKQGTILAPMSPLILTYGSQGVEAVLRGLYYAGRLERRFGIRFALAQPMENQTQPLGVASLWAGAGAKYCWNGVCACESPVTGLHRRPYELYWWKGLDGSRLLTKWYNVLDGKSLGGYAEMRRQDMGALRAKARLFGGIAGGFGWGWDDLSSQTTWFEDQAAAARMFIYPTRLISSRMSRPGWAPHCLSTAQLLATTGNSGRPHWRR